MRHGYETVIWATDGSTGAEAALDEAIRLAALSGGKVYAVHCDQRLNGRPGGWRGLHEEDDPCVVIRRRVAQLGRQGVHVVVVIRRSHRDAADTVADVAVELGGDIIVCGTRGLGAIAGAFLGSFTQRLLHIAPCPVLAVPGRLASQAEAKPRLVEVST
jgi:nucleotide-binding universal stress UspA family protein